MALQRHIARLGVAGVLSFMVMVGLAAQAAPEADPQPSYKLMQDNGLAINARFGSFLWSGLAWPTDASGAVIANTNGINGKNFLYPNIPVIGVGVRIGLGPLLRLEPSLDFIFDEYVYRADLSRAFRTQSMSGNQIGPLATVMGIMVSVPVWFDFALGDRLVFSAAPGLVFYPRFAVAAIDGSTGIEQITTDLNREARWLVPQTGLALRYALGKDLSAGLQVQVLYPLYHAWSTDGLPFYEELSVKGAIAIDFWL